VAQIQEVLVDLVLPGRAITVALMDLGMEEVVAVPLL